ncbi:hypothetical protein [Paludibacterium paludis]|uniref:Uncharacterized protein n=1 Tax=Paludibacterium paludis TaxID=1225769 RepID=A0A918NYF4_9NEIS|nr:hypothetical protein [Paludibacterium paludis]GGY05842.1 hypothetical protein GCM10011289_05320 [Paludibacterium paludis]
MLKVDTYFRVDNSFVKAEDYDGDLHDKNYIEGSLSISANDFQVVDMHTWDYIDQLWSYVVDGVCEVSSGKSCFFHFPDQPIKVSFDVMGEGLVKISIDFDGGRCVEVDKDEFVYRFTEAGARFFCIMKEKDPESNDCWDYYLEKLSQLH